MNLDTLIDQWIGKEKKYKHPLEDGCTIQCECFDCLNTYFTNQALQDLKSRKQELIEGIVKIADGHKIVKAPDESDVDYTIRHTVNMVIDELIKELTGK